MYDNLFFHNEGSSMVINPVQSSPELLGSIGKIIKKNTRIIFLDKKFICVP